MIYEPREDSFLLQKHVSTYAQGKVLDMGTGSGIQAATAYKTTKDVLASDINEEVITNFPHKDINIIKSDLFENIPPQQFDLIIFNPPYLPEDERETMEDSIALTGGKYGYEILQRFFIQAKEYLSKQGKILITFSNITGDIEFILKQQGYTFKKLDEKKFFFEKLYVYIIEKE